MWCESYCMHGISWAARAEQGASRERERREREEREIGNTCTGTYIQQETETGRRVGKEGRVLTWVGLVCVDRAPGRTGSVQGVWAMREQE